MAKKYKLGEMFFFVNRIMSLSSKSKKKKQEKEKRKEKQSPFNCS